MKNWRFVQTGNYDAQKELGLKPAPFNPNQLKSEDEKKVKDLFQKNGGDYEKTIKDIKAEYKSLPEDGIRRMLYNIVGVPQKAKNESIDKQEASMFKGLAKDAEKEVGNETPEEMEVKYKGYKITYFPYQGKYMVRHPSEVSGLMQKHFTSVDEAKKAIDKKSVGNETKAEEKFGKVMGEYEEGALKTPQGKTVTDPAQAKAIAYSEADKVDNLKRARNAMNKKK